jgi:hypothetical protein
VYVALTASGRALDVPTTGTVEAAVETALGRCEASDVTIAYRVLDALKRSLVEQETTRAAPTKRSRLPPGARRRP